MTPRYEEARGARFTAESFGRGQRFTIRPPRNLLTAGLLAFSAIVLAGVGEAGMSSLSMMLSIQAAPLVGVERFLPAMFYAFAVVVVLALAVGLSSLLLTLSWMLGGAEVLDVSDGDLTVTYRVLGFARTKHYRGDDISDVAGHVAPALRRDQGSIPLLWAARTGSARFTYGARTVYLAQDLDIGEGRLLAAALRESLRASGACRLSRNEL